MNVSLLDKPRIRQSFAAASATYDRAAALQRQSANELLRFAGSAPGQGTLLDLGCGTGNLSERLLAAPVKPGRLIALDIAAAMLETARTKLDSSVASNLPLHYVCADAEQLPFADGSIDGAYSNLALQWCQRLDRVLSDLKRILKPESPLVFSTFGPNTLQELKSAWAQVDGSPHVNDFVSRDDLRRLLEEAGFRELKIEQDLQVPRYASVIELMRELKQIGAHNAHAARPKNLTGKSRMQAMYRAYEYHRADGTLPATFEIIRIAARA